MQNITGNPSLKKDPKSGCIMNVDRNAYEAFLSRKKREKDMQARIMHLEQRLAAIEQLLSKQ